VRLESKAFRVRLLFPGLPPEHCHRKFDLLRAPSLKAAVANALDLTLESPKAIPRQPVRAVILVESLARENS
jgi:hypothetical protein